jgi:DNA polymerase
VSPARSSAAELADLVRQAREQLGRVRESRWQGFTAPARTPAARSTANRGTAASPVETPTPWDSLAAIAAAASACTRCPLHATRTHAVPGEGDPRARLMFVGEAPGADEDAQGRPFVGKAGQLLDKMILAMGLARGEVFIANVLKCRPPGNRDPQPHEVAACLPYLQAQLALVRPEIICSLGKHAAHALLGSTDPISRLRGRFFEYRGVPLLPTFHPSYLLRSPEEKRTAWKDLQLVMQRLGLSAPAQRPEPTEAGK